jgi:site-specific recombinase XerD
MAQQRRDKGDGSIYQRKSDGRWIAKYVPVASGKAKVLYGKTEQEVKKKLREFKKDVAQNGYLEIQKISVQMYMDKWFREVKTNELKPKSLDALDVTLKNQIYPYIGDIQIGALNANDVQKMINDLAEKKLSYSTIKKAYDAINPCFKLGIIKEEIKRNPCLGVKLPKQLERRKNNIRFFTQDEADKISRECLVKTSNGKQVYRLGQAVIVLLNTGMRIGELLGMKWKDIDYEGHTAVVRDSVVLIKDRERNEDDTTPKYKMIEQDSTKTSSGERIIQLNKKAINALKEIQIINGKFNHVMANSNGNILVPRNFDRMLRAILERCNIKPCGAHVLRHTFASLLFKNGVDAKTVSVLLGHKDVSITYDIYIHLIIEQKQQAVDILDAL